MSSRQPTKNSFIRSRYTPIATSINSIQFKNDRLWKLRNGQFFTEHEGREISATEFDKLFPTYTELYNLYKTYTTLHKFVQLFLQHFTQLLQQLFF